ncbi:putative ankyrin repeat protein RF_0381 [Microplitis mediator]|uniref:putative ankyrin repeat protein RF_0381 n=1 Tax=Microplitis mediator TaxID=375433 RepID=UPI0025554DF9|nr:putative ankyrin repeat protein RF_0381 [Microplitis mediator]
MSSVTSSDITSSNQVRDEDKNCDLNESEVSVISSKNRVPQPVFENELRKIAESLKKNGVELRRCTSNCLVGGSLEDAIRVGDIKLVKLRIRQGVNVNGSEQKSSSPLHMAAWYGHPEIIELLINNGARLDSVLNGPIKNGFTPLHLACLNNKIECVKVLLKYGASVTPKCADVYHPIHFAVFKNFVEVAALLLENGADVNLRFNNKFFHNKWDQSIFWKDMDLTLLHYSIAQEYEEITTLLLEHGADIHLNTRTNKTSLMHAVEAYNVPLVESLLAKGANPNDRDIYGEPVAFYIFVNANNQSSYYDKKEFCGVGEKLEIIKLLYAAGADVNYDCCEAIATSFNNQELEDFLNLCSNEIIS